MSSENQPPIVFYSWQSDVPPKTNRNVIEDAIERACKDLSAELELALRVASDIKRESGMPDIAATILEKIENAYVVVTDVSTTGSASVTASDHPETRVVLNPNVIAAERHGR